MTGTTKQDDVVQADREAAANYGRMVGRITERDADRIRAGEWDETKDVQFFTRLRTASTAPMREALELARVSIRLDAERLRSLGRSTMQSDAALVCIDAALASEEPQS